MDPPDGFLWLLPAEGIILAAAPVGTHVALKCRPERLNPEHQESRMEKTLAKLRTKQPITIVVVGDSNTLVSMNTQGKLNWVGYLTEALWETYGDDLVTMINVSACGYNFRRLSEELEHRVLRWQPDLVITQMWLGDLKESAEGRDQSRDAFRAAVEGIRGGGSGETEFLVCTPNPMVLGHGHLLPEGALPGEVYESPEWNTALNAELVKLAEEAGCAVVDHFTAWQGKEYVFAHPGANPRGLWQRMLDPVHPNALGQLIFFRELAPVFGVSKYFPWEEIEGP